LATYRLEISFRAVLHTTLVAPAISGPAYSIDWQHTYTDGLNLGQIDACHLSSRTLAPSGTEDLDLSGTALKQPDNTNLGLTKARVFVIHNTGSAELVISRPAANGLVLWSAASDAVRLPPGGLLPILLAGIDEVGIAVTGATGDLVTVTNADAALSAAYDVLIAGI